VVLEKSFKEKVYGWMDDGRWLIPIAHFQPLAQVS